MPRVPAHLHKRVLGMLQGGVRPAEVARAINCNVRTVRRLRQRYTETGWTADRPRSGRPRVTKPAQDRYIRTAHLRDRYRMATTTAQVTPGTHNPSISAQTVRNRLREAGLRACRPAVFWPPLCSGTRYSNSVSHMSVELVHFMSQLLNLVMVIQIFTHIKFAENKSSWQWEDIFYFFAEFTTALRTISYWERIELPWWTSLSNTWIQTG